MPHKHPHVRFAAPDARTLGRSTTRMLPYLIPNRRPTAVLARRRTGRRVTFEYTLLSGVNDDIKHVGRDAVAGIRMHHTYTLKISCYLASGRERPDIEHVGGADLAAVL